MEMLSIILCGFITIFSLGLLAVSLFSFGKFKTTKLLVVSLVFLIFFIKGILMSLGLFYTMWGLPTANDAFLFLDVLILGFLFVVTLKR